MTQPTAEQERAAMPTFTVERSSVVMTVGSCRITSEVDVERLDRWEKWIMPDGEVLDFNSGYVRLGQRRWIRINDEGDNVSGPLEDDQVLALIAEENRTVTPWTAFRRKLSNMLKPAQ